MSRPVAAAGVNPEFKRGRYDRLAGVRRRWIGRSALPAQPMGDATALDAVEQAVSESVRRCLNNGEAGAIDGATPLLDQGVLDSLALVELLMALAERFEIEFEEHDLSRENFATIRDIARLVERKQAAV